jgi:hypothetical protein
MAGSYEVALVVLFHAVVFAIKKDDVHADRGRHGIKERGEFEKDSDPARGIIGAEDRQVPELRMFVVLRSRARVPVCAQEHASREFRAKGSDDVRQVQGLAIVPFRSELLEADFIRPLAQGVSQIGSACFMSCRVGVARTERSLFQEVRKGPFPAKCRNCCCRSFTGLGERMLAGSSARSVAVGNSRQRRRATRYRPFSTYGST